MNTRAPRCTCGRLDDSHSLTSHPDKCWEKASRSIPEALSLQMRANSGGNTKSAVNMALIEQKSIMKKSIPLVLPKPNAVSVWPVCSQNSPARSQRNVQPKSQKHWPGQILSSSLLDKELGDIPKLEAAVEEPLTTNTRGVAVQTGLNCCS